MRFKTDNPGKGWLTTVDKLPKQASGPVSTYLFQGTCVRLIILPGYTNYMLVTSPIRGECQDLDIHTNDNTIQTVLIHSQKQATTSLDDKPPHTCRSRYKYFAGLGSLLPSATTVG
jgi:hypothetical protein